MKTTLSMNLIGVNSLIESRPFYENVLQMKFAEFRPPFAEAVLGEHFVFNIEENADYRDADWAQHHIGGYKSCVFGTDNIAAFRELVIQYGGAIVTEPVLEPWGYWIMKFTDPTGNVFIVEQEDSKSE